MARIFKKQGVTALWNLISLFSFSLLFSLVVTCMMEFSSFFRTNSVSVVVNFVF